VTPGANVPPNRDYVVRIEARGYTPAVSAAQVGSATVNFELTPGKDIIGHVYGIDGKPAANVSVAASILGASNVSVQPKGRLDVRPGIVATSLADGTYDLPPQTGDFMIVACSPDGYAQPTQDDIAKSADVHLLPWGSVEGRIMLGTKPEAGRDVIVASAANAMLEPSVIAYATAKSDADGHFVVTDVRPGHVQVSRVIPAHIGPPNRMVGSVATFATILNVQSGKTATVNLGGGGREVVGRIIIPDSFDKYRYTLAAGATPTAQVIAQMPDEVKKQTPEEQLRWKLLYAATPSGREYFQAHPEAAPTSSMYWLEFGDTGTFHIEGVKPGDYHIEIKIEVYFGPNDDQLVQSEATFTMPPITPDVADQPLQIPDITVTTSLQPGSETTPGVRQAITFTGSVLDAETHLPIDGFVAIAGYAQDTHHSVNYVIDADHPPQQFRAGQYELVFTVPQPCPSYVRIEAHGYLPAVSEVQYGSGTVDFQLTRAKDIVGHVYGIDGKPAADVRVAAEIPSLGPTVYIHNGDVLMDRAGRITASAADGTYDLSPQTGEFLIEACNSDGFACLNQDEIAKSADIHLLAWGSVEGRVMLGNEPAEGSDIVEDSILNNPSDGPESQGGTVRVVHLGAGGRFTFQKVEPGRALIFRRFSQTMAPHYPQVRVSGVTQLVQAMVEPGKTVVVNLSGGRKVLVKVILPDTVLGGQYVVSSTVTNPPTVPIILPMPDAVKTGSAEVRDAWTREFAATPAGREYLQSHPIMPPATAAYALEYGGGNTFHIEGVQPGDYQIHLTLQRVGEVGGQRAEATFTMPPITPDVADKPLEIPDITVAGN
jgi:hypothetical protein